MISLLTSTGDYLRHELNYYVRTVSSKFNDWDIRYYIDEKLARNAKTKPEKKARLAGSPWLLLESEVSKSQSLQSDEMDGDDLISVYNERLELPVTLTLVCLIGEINAARPEMRWKLLNKIRGLTGIGNDFTDYDFETLKAAGKQDLTGRMIDFEEPFEHHFEIPINVQGIIETGRVNRGGQKFDKLSGTLKIQEL